MISVVKMAPKLLKSLPINDIYDIRTIITLNIGRVCFVGRRQNIVTDYNDNVPSMIRRKERGQFLFSLIFCGGCGILQRYCVVIISFYTRYNCFRLIVSNVRTAVHCNMQTRFEYDKPDKVVISFNRFAAC